MQAAKWLVACLLVAAPCLGAAELRPDRVGARYGFCDHSVDLRFTQAEVFADWDLPWSWAPGANWSLRSQWGLSAGWLSKRGEESFVGTVGPALALSRNELPLELVGGVSPTLLQRSGLGGKDFGTFFQFTSHIGVRWAIGPHWDLGYRIQHMSNAGIGRHNPGLNLNMFSAGYRF